MNIFFLDFFRFKMNYLTKLVIKNVKISSSLLSTSTRNKINFFENMQKCKISISSVLNSGTKENINIGTIGKHLC